MGAVTDQIKFWEAPIDTLNRAQWEALCDGCGKCCLNKVEDEDTGRIYPTNVACKLLDLQTYRSAADYKQPQVRSCPIACASPSGKIEDYGWLPSNLRLCPAGHAGAPLPKWHYLLSGRP